MAKPRAKKLAYKDYVEAVSPVDRAKKRADFPRLIVVYGSSEFLLNKFCIRIKDKWESLGEPSCNRIEAVGLSPAQFHAILEEESLFEPVSFNIIARADQRGDMWKLFAGITDEKKIKNNLCVAISSEKILAKLKKEFDRLGAYLVPCTDPKPYEMNSIVEAIAEKAGMQLDKSAVDLILEAVGGDLTKLENEVNKLALIFAESSEVIKADEIAEHLGMLREDHTFKLTDLIVQNRGAMAHALAVDLLRRGEKCEKIIGFLAMHCRDSIKIRESAGGTAAGVHPYKVKKYSRYVSSAPKGTFSKALECCREVDLLLKSSTTSKELLLARVIDSLIFT